MTTRDDALALRLLLAFTLLSGAAAAATAEPVRAAVFRAASFPTADAPAIDDATLHAALAGLPVDTLDSPDALASRLGRKDHAVLVLPYGSAFPLEAWPAIRAFVKEGGGLVVLGGAPFHQPVRQEKAADGARYVLGPRQPTYAHELLIGPADELDPAWYSGPLRATAPPGGEWDGALPEPTRTWALTVRLATREDLPGEGGTAGPRDGVVRPLVHLVDAKGVARLCPLLEIDRLRGTEEGARWVLAPSDARLDAATIRKAVERALEGAAELDARPVRAAVEPGEPPVLRVILRRPAPRAGETVPSRAHVVVRGDGGAEVFTGDVELAGAREMRGGLVTVRTAAPLAPGLYHAEVGTPDAPWHPRSAVTGFWVKDAALLASGPKLTASRDWLRADGRVRPIVGTTYMASDVHRKFLFEPNPHVWDRDFAFMRSQGINMVRTGLWTAWTRVMLDPGAVDENVLSALDAYVLSAAKHGILVCFNFFAFLPPSYGDSNPYLGPRALEGQRAFLTMVARRYRGVGWVHWDLINEPSYAPPSGVWSNLPIGDEHEARAWREWVQAKHGDDPLVLRDLWRDASPGVLGVPGPDEVGYSFLRESRRPRKVRDFFEFTQAAAARWAGTLRDVLKAAGGDLLVTLGQDEGGTGTRPAPLFFADSLDYTAVHTWWNNDDLLWDGFMTKSPDKANLHQETGLMSLHDLDGAPWRTPRAAASLLDRKFAYAFAGRGAGVVQWAWNVNPYMPIDNEATIGFNRPDGTAKIEMDVAPAFADVLAKAAPYLDDFAPEPVAIVIPYARLFSGRPGGIDHTKRIVRLLAERHGIVPQALPDLRLTAERLRGVTLALVPSPEMLDEDAARALLEASRAGTRVLVTGHVEGDSYGRPTPSLKALGLLGDGRPVALRETTAWGAAPGRTEWVTFESLAQHWLRRGPGKGLTALNGSVWHEPLPLDFARETAPLEALLAAALKAAGVATHPAEGGVAARVLVAPKSILVVCVNEGPSAARRRVVVEGRPVEIPVEGLRSRLALFERGTGRLLAATPGDAIGRAGTNGRAR
ncbi:MAG TPA: hypothetical protein VMT70_13045 [Vicinamibacteria bacterium]|nr:hypothetical protein [Vicinamibacteria bacterium]